MMERVIGFVFMAFFMSLKVLIAQEDWRLRKDKSGVQVYTRSQKGSDFKMVRTVCTLQTTLTRMTAVLLDVMRTPEWVYGTKTCRLLKTESPSVLYYYAEMAMPWLVANRDFIIRISVGQDPDTKAVSVTAENQPSHLPVNKDLVRIQISSGQWTITPLPDGRVRVQYDLHVDPGGQLPAAIVNSFTYEGPFESFRKLPSRVAMPEYANVRLPFIRD